MSISQSSPKGTFTRLRRKRSLFALTLVAIVGGTLVFPFPMEGRFWGDMFDLAHAPVFCLSLICLVGFFDPSAVGAPSRFSTIIPMTVRRVLFVTAGLMVLGMVAEYLQKFAHRSPSWGDVAANSAGLTAGCAWICAVALKGLRRWILAFMTIAILAGISANPAIEVWDSIQQMRSFPVLASFEITREVGNWGPHKALLELTDEWSSDGRQSAKLTMQAEQFPGLAMLWMNHDWTGFRYLKFDIRNPGDKPLSLIIKVQDKLHTQTGFKYRDRYHQKIVIDPETVANVVVDLAAVKAAPEGRTMNMTEINLIDLFGVDVTEPTVLYLDYVRLE